MSIYVPRKSWIYASAVLVAAAVFALQVADSSSADSLIGGGEAVDYKICKSGGPRKCTGGASGHSSDPFYDKILGVVVDKIKGLPERLTIHVDMPPVQNSICLRGRSTNGNVAIAPTDIDTISPEDGKIEHTFPIAEWGLADSEEPSTTDDPLTIGDKSLEYIFLAVSGKCDHPAASGGKEFRVVYPVSASLEGGLAGNSLTVYMQLPEEAESDSSPNYELGNRDKRVRCDSYSGLNYNHSCTFERFFDEEISSRTFIITRGTEMLLEGETLKPLGFELGHPKIGEVVE